MAYKGKIIHNFKTGQTLEFITTSKDSDGKLLEMVSTYKPHSKEPASHYHPSQDERFIILKGKMNVRLNGKIVTLKQGDSIDIPRNTVHSMWNNSNQKTIVHWKVMPALQTEYFLETLMGLSNDGKTGFDGKPRMLQVALLGKKYCSEFRLAKPSYKIQKIIFDVLAPVALLKGKKSLYEAYID